MIKGNPGSGKTQSIITIIKEMSEQNQTVLVLTKSNNQKENILSRLGIKLKGVNVCTIESSYNFKSSYQNIIIDEASMSHIFQIIHIFNEHIKTLILVGDESQLVCQDSQFRPFSLNVSSLMQIQTNNIEYQNLTHRFNQEHCVRINNLFGKKLTSNVTTQFRYEQIIVSNQRYQETLLNILDTIKYDAILTARNSTVNQLLKLQPTNNVMTIAKSQGSEFNKVLLITMNPQQEKMNLDCDKSMLYVAYTRSTQLLCHLIVSTLGDITIEKILQWSVRIQGSTELDKDVQRQGQTEQTEQTLMCYNYKQIQQDNIPNINLLIRTFK